MVYSTDNDLVNLRPNILNNGQASFAWAHTQAYGIINTTIEAEWYIAACPMHSVDSSTTAMDVTKLDTTQLRQLSIYKALELIYISLAKDVPTEDGPFQWAAWARQQYEEELSRLLKIGFTYDWAGDGITQADKFEPYQPRLIRC